MSYVTDLVLIGGYDIRREVDEFNAWCAEHDAERHQRFRPLDMNAAGGTKVMGVEVFAMGGNYFPWYDLTAAIRDGELDLRPGHILVIQPEDGPGRVLISTWNHGVEEHQDGAE